jgi:hypothetical protein
VNPRASSEYIAPRLSPLIVCCSSRSENDIGADQADGATPM